MLTYHEGFEQGVRRTKSMELYPRPVGDIQYLSSRLLLRVPGHCQEENTKSNRTWMEMLANKNHQRAPCLVDNELCIARRESRSHFQLLADSCGESQSNR